MSEKIFRMKICTLLQQYKQCVQSLRNVCVCVCCERQTHFHRSHQASACSRSGSSTCNSHMCSCTCVYRALASARTHSGLQTERDSVSGLQDGERGALLHRGEISQRAEVKRSITSNLTHPFQCGFEVSVCLSVCLCMC